MITFMLIYYQNINGKDRLKELFDF